MTEPTDKPPTRRESLRRLRKRIKDDDQPMTREEVCVWCRWSESHLRRLIQLQGFPRFRAGRVLRSRVALWLNGELRSEAVKPKSLGGGYGVGGKKRRRGREVDLAARLEAR